MRILADENIQDVTVQFLRGRGWDIVAAADEGLSGLSDERIFEHAQAHQRIVLTYNAHFSDLRELAADRHVGVIRLRFSNQRAAVVHPLLESALEKLKGQDLRDALVTLSDDRIRVRKTLSHHP